ncbi:MAG: carboxymuconolactone decarboxylase [Alphaproteobacteria bacterium CG_4_9_14_3_um_filter_47_13]|nr:MAG: carboxymuconolactone decarboxylase [Alphaproteobacteria bacterium CG_4_9_14_3_um_filter_47_13]
MSYLEPKNPETITGEHKALFDQINNAFGAVPNMFKVIGNSSAALESMWTSFGALSKGKIGAKLGEQIAVLVANMNRCEYCLSAHTVLGQNVGVSAEDMAKAQEGRSSDPKTQAALDFSAKLVKNHGQVSQNDISSVRNAGFNDEEIAEILAHVALNIFTNYTNIAFDVTLDFPKTELRAAA